MTLGSKLLVIAGPTASGKTQSALRLAQELNGEIVNADSVQVYRGFDIGSAKPTLDQQQLVPHHLIDILNPNEFIDAAQYAARADKAIVEILSRQKLPIIAGGTGLWLRALLRGLVDVPAANATIRARLEAEAKAHGVPQLHSRLREVDPIAAERIHPNDALRIIRALEVYEQTGQALGELQAAHALGAPRYQSLFVVLDAPKQELEQPIRLRVADMLARGWVDETRALYKTWGPEVRAFGSVGYRQLRDFIEEKSDLATAEQEAVKATRVYARRQRTWFSSEPGVDWRLDAAALTGSEGIARINHWMQTKAS